MMYFANYLYYVTLNKFHFLSQCHFLNCVFIYLYYNFQQHNDFAARVFLNCTRLQLIPLVETTSTWFNYDFSIILVIEEHNGTLKYLGARRCQLSSQYKLAICHWDNSFYGFDWWPSIPKNSASSKILGFIYTILMILI